MLYLDKHVCSVHLTCLFRITSGQCYVFNFVNKIFNAIKVGKDIVVG